ncbi:MAG: enoyl-CoA hydratase-related protein [Alphaproteobacteria bacterium]
MSYECFDVSIKDDVAHIVLSRPERRNAMAAAFWDELPEIVEKIDQEAAAKVIVISSTGPHFTAGLDISAIGGGGGKGSSLSEEQAAMQHRIKGAKFYQNVKHMQNSFSILENCRIPVIAAVQGGAFGGGVDLLTACSMRFCTEDAFLTIFEIEVGMTADVGTFPRVLNHFPEGLVHELAYTGRRMFAQEAKTHGFFNEIYADHDAMLDAVMKIARDIAQKPALAIWGCKHMIKYSRDHTTEDALDYIAIWNASNLQPEEMMEAMVARAEKRPGKFVDLPPIRNKTAI